KTKDKKAKAALEKQISSQKTKITNATNKFNKAKDAARLATEASKKASKKAAAKTVSKKIGKKVVAKAAGKAAAKTAAKKIPVLGLLAGIAFAADRALHGDFAGAAMEVVSGAASCVPGVGTAASVAIDAGLMYKDLKASKAI
ncbi:hypothetical protein IJF81_03715, partial [bacterium]|nr:hypothetical protein [bacterium]